MNQPQKVKKYVIANEVKQSQQIKYQWHKIVSCLAMTKNYFSKWLTDKICNLAAD